MVNLIVSYLEHFTWFFTVVNVEFIVVTTNSVAIFVSMLNFLINYKLIMLCIYLYILYIKMVLN